MTTSESAGQGRQRGVRVLAILGFAIAVLSTGSLAFSEWLSFLLLDRFHFAVEAAFHIGVVALFMPPLVGGMLSFAAMRSSRRRPFALPHRWRQLTYAGISISCLTATAYAFGAVASW